MPQSLQRKPKHATVTRMKPKNHSSRNKYKEVLKQNLSFQQTLVPFVHFRGTPPGGRSEFFEPKLEDEGG